MPDWQTIDPWLSNVGNYKHHCFISWPHTGSKDITKCALRVRDEIQSKLADTFLNPSVFLDERGLKPGDDWDSALRQALCKSVSMVAICSPIYFRTEHRWCGLEWASMYQLSQCRLPNVTYTSIIPLMLKETKPLPWASTSIQHIDVSRVLVRGPQYFREPDFREKINLIVSRIEEIAVRLWENKSVAQCDLFQFPTESAFAQYSIPSQAFPLVS